MQKPKILENPRTNLLLVGARIVVAFLAVHALPLHAEDKEKDKEKNKKQESARPAPKPAAAAPRPQPQASEPRPQPQAPRPRPEAPRPEPHSPAPSAPAGRGEPLRPAPAPMAPSPTGRPEGLSHREPPAAASPARPEPRPVPAPNMPAPTGRPGLPATSPAMPGPHPIQSPATPGQPVHPGPAGRGEPFREHGQPGGRPFERAPERQVVRTPNGGEIHRTPSGAIREVHTANGAIIRHAPSGVRHVEMVRPGGRLIVANATGRSGYIQRPLVSHGYTYVQRTYIYNGVPRAAIYRPWSYGGREYHVYMPHHYYRPAFYSWAYDPWAVPVSYSWGWHARPWYGYYGGYFTPYRTYVSPSFWLADFIIAATLESAYLAQNASVSAPPVTYSASTALTPEVKDMIAEEVRRQMDQARADQAAAQNMGMPSAPPPIFSDRGPKVFLVSNSVLAYAGNQECPLAEGDVLQLVQTPSQTSEWAEVKVLSSRGSSCPRGSYLSVKTMDLQEMQNHLQASVDQGMAKLQADQGRDGIPSLPPQAMGTVKAAYTDDIRPDANVQSELSLAVGEANRSEQAIINEGAAYPAPPGSTATVTLGMTIAQVEAALGRPKNTVDLGAKKIHVYQDLKVTFLNGRVSDVQ